MEPSARLRDADRRRHEQLRRRGCVARPHRRLRRVVPEAGPHRRRGQSTGTSVWLAELVQARGDARRVRRRGACGGPSQQVCRVLHVRCVAALPPRALRPRAVYSRVARYPYSLRVV